MGVQAAHARYSFVDGGSGSIAGYSRREQGDGSIDRWKIRDAAA